MRGGRGQSACVDGHRCVALLRRGQARQASGGRRVQAPHKSVLPPHLVQAVARLKGAAPAIKHAEDGAAARRGGRESGRGGAGHGRSLRGDETGDWGLSRWACSACVTQPAAGARCSPAACPPQAAPPLQPLRPPKQASGSHVVLPVPERPSRMSDCGGWGARSMSSCRCVGGGGEETSRQAGGVIRSGGPQPVSAGVRPAGGERSSAAGVCRTHRQALHRRAPPPRAPA